MSSSPTHAAFDSVEAVNELRHKAAANVTAVLRGDRPRNVVNPDVYQARQSGA